MRIMHRSMALVLFSLMCFAVTWGGDYKKSELTDTETINTTNEVSGDIVFLLFEGVEGKNYQVVARHKSTPAPDVHYRTSLEGYPEVVVIPQPGSIVVCECYEDLDWRGSSNNTCVIACPGCICEDCWIEPSPLSIGAILQMGPGLGTCQ